MSVVTYVKEHPYLSGTVAVGLVVVFFLVRRGASGSGGTTIVAGGGPSESLQAMGLQAGSAVQMAQIQANAAVQGYSAQVNLAELFHAADTYKAGLDQKVQLEYIYASKDVSLAQTDAALRLGLAQTGSITPNGAGGGTSVQVNLANPAGGTGSAFVPIGRGTVYTIDQQQQAAVAGVYNTALTTSQDAAYQVGAGTGQVIHGVATATNYGTLDTSIALANQAAVEASYALHPGSYLAGDVYAGTAEAWAIYGDPRVSYQDYLRGDTNPYDNQVSATGPVLYSSANNPYAQMIPLDTSGGLKATLPGSSVYTSDIWT